MIGDRRVADEGREAGAPHGVILAIVVAAVTVFPHVIGEQGEVILEAISELFTPVGLLVLTVTLLFTIQILSSDRSSDLLRGLLTPEGICGSRDSPVGVVLFLLIVLFLLYNRGSLLGGGGGDDGDD